MLDVSSSTAPVATGVVFQLLSLQTCSRNCSLGRVTSATSRIYARPAVPEAARLLAQHPAAAPAEKHDSRKDHDQEPVGTPTTHINSRMSLEKAERLSRRDMGVHNRSPESSTRPATLILFVRFERANCGEVRALAKVDHVRW